MIGCRATPRDQVGGVIAILSHSHYDGDLRSSRKEFRMRLLLNQIYEFRKGVRSLFMLTATGCEIAQIRLRLDREGIDHFPHFVSPTKANIFFGRGPWVETARRIVTGPLNQLSPEEDFILGTLLGYDGEGQCRRYLTRRLRHDGPPPAGERRTDWQGASAGV